MKRSFLYLSEFHVGDKFTIFCTNPVNGNSMQYDTFSDVDINDIFVRTR